MPVDDHLRPSCWPEDAPCPNPCARAHYARVVHNHTPLYGPWAGWRLAGRELVSPGRGSDAMRISPERLLGLLWREAAEARIAAAKAVKSGHRGKVVALMRDRSR